MINRIAQNFFKVDEILRVDEFKNKLNFALTYKVGDLLNCFVITTADIYNPYNFISTDEELQFIHDNYFEILKQLTTNSELVFSEKLINNIKTSEIVVSIKNHTIRFRLYKEYETYDLQDIIFDDFIEVNSNLQYAEIFNYKKFEYEIILHHNYKNISKDYYGNEWFL